MKQYLDVLRNVLENGNISPDRTGIGTKSLFALPMRFNLEEGFPAVTTKKLAWKSVVSELLWFIEGSSNEKRLKEILYGTETTDKQTIWTANAEAPYWKPKARYEGDLGRVYGVQWRDWKSPILVRDHTAGYEYVPERYDVKQVDQLLNLIDGLKKDPHGRRHIISAWNPGELDEMALPPCHCFAQFYVANGKLSCSMYQRSCDLFLGVPFNIASYSLFTHMIARVCDLGVGEFVHILGDAHIYLNHIEQVKEQLSREPLPLPKLEIANKKDITSFTMDDIRLVGYECHGPIKAEMAV